MLAILIGALCVFGFGGLLLILFFGARGIEERLAEEQRQAREVRGVVRVPQFLVMTRPEPPRLADVDEPMLWQLRQYLEAEQMLAEEFVSQPSLENLYRESGRRLLAN